MAFRLQRRRWVVLSWLILATCGHAVAFDRPGEFQVVDDKVLRDRAVVDLGRFAKEFSGTPAAVRAGEIAAKEGKSADTLAWVGPTLDWAELGLKAYPPSTENHKRRRAILRILDYPLHVNSTPMRSTRRYVPQWAEAVGKHFQRAVEPAIKDVTDSRTTRGLDVWKIYDMGFVARSKSHCVGFDVHPGFFRLPYALTDAQIDALIGRLEVLFISHAHLDHLNDRFVQRMLAAGKKVVLPAPVRKDLTHEGVVRLHDDYARPTEVAGLKVYVFPGWQGKDTPMNVYAVELDGHWVAHNGDNLRTEIYREIPGRCAVDVLLVNCWSGLGAFISATHPKLAITGHENELAHAVPQRVAYGTTFAYLDMVRDPPEHRVIHWGERVHWEPAGRDE
ncbi:MAG: hypothetical protein JXQ73_29445 [Phycisphaerae bacterium]|nr:hypothetical protein [Phycisphaerae bacterium]